MRRTYPPDVQHPVQRILWDAARMVEQGWIQGATHDEPTYRVCTSEAIRRAGKMLDGRHMADAFYHFSHFINTEMLDGKKSHFRVLKSLRDQTTVEAWNDDPRRLHGEVVETLEQAALWRSAWTGDFMHCPTCNCKEEGHG